MISKCHTWIQFGARLMDKLVKLTSKLQSLYYCKWQMCAQKKFFVGVERRRLCVRATQLKRAILRNENATETLKHLTLLQEVIALRTVPRTT